MISQRRQRLITAGMVVVAFGALALGVAYQDEDRLQEPVIVGQGSDDGADPGPAATGETATTLAGGDAADVPTSSGAIEGFLPEGGEASACREPIGVDLAAGFGARLIINGVEITPEQMNVNLDDSGEITNVITPSRSLGHYTFRPDDTCPNGRFLRPLDNVLEVCVFRFDDPSEGCTLETEYVFDAL